VTYQQYLISMWDISRWDAAAMPVWEMSEIADIDVGHAIHGNQKNLYRTVKLYWYEKHYQENGKRKLKDFS